MKNEYQDAEWIVPKAQKMFIKNPRRSLSATFRYFRNHPRVSLIGCYPILSGITRVVLSIGIPLSRNKLLYALNQSDELKTFTHGEKKQLIDQLLNPVSVATKRPKNVHRDMKKELLTNDSLPIKELKNYA